MKSIRRRAERRVVYRVHLTSGDIDYATKK